MTTPKEAKDLLVEAQAAFNPVVGAPNNDDVKNLNEAFVNSSRSTSQAARSIYPTSSFRLTITRLNTEATRR